MVKFLFVVLLAASGQSVDMEFELVTKEVKAGSAYAARNLTPIKMRCTLYTQRKLERFIVYPYSTSRFYNFPDKPIIHCRVA